MDGEITAIPSSTVEANGGEGDTLSQTPDSFREIFDRVFPAYLAIGMSYEEFYCKDHTLVIAYREAQKRKRDMENENMWIQGAYIYEAFRRVAPLLVAFAKNPKEIPYLDKPLPVFESPETDAEKEQKANVEKGMAYMQAMTIAINNKFGNKE